MSSTQAHTFKSDAAAADNAIAVWSFAANEHCLTRVIPDGCCDIIVATKKSNSLTPSWFISQLSRSTYEVACGAGESMHGIRLSPGTKIDRSRLDLWVKSNSVRDLFVGDQVDEFCVQSRPLIEALNCLASGVNTINIAARQLGVSPRTLQRIVKNGTGKTPYFWFSLSRIRNTARSLHKFDRLADAAAALHFSDQAHMSREMKHWLGLAPGDVKNDVELFTLLAQPGYG